MGSILRSMVIPTCRLPMTWTPTDEELVRVWIAYTELNAEKRVGLNLSGNTGGIPTNARDFHREVAERGTDIVQTPGARCISPPDRLLEVLAQHRGTTVEEALPSERIAAEMNALQSVDRDRSRAITDHVKEAVGRTPRLARTLGQVARSVLPMLALLFLVLSTFGELDAQRPILAIGLILYAFAVWHLLRGVVDPTGFFVSMRQSSSSPEGLTPVGHVARSVSILFFAFVVVSWVAWDLTEGSFMLANDPGAIDWMVYGVDNVVRTLGLDLLEIFRVDVSPIEHGEGFLPAAFVFVFRTTLGVSAIALIVEATRRYPHWR